MNIDRVQNCWANTTKSRPHTRSAFCYLFFVWLWTIRHHDCATCCAETRTQVRVAQRSEACRMVQAQQGEPKQRRCPFGHRLCFYFSSRRRATTNLHSKFVSVCGEINKNFNKMFPQTLLPKPSRGANKNIFKSTFAILSFRLFLSKYLTYC